MNEKQAIREYLTFTGVTQTELAERAGLKRQSNVSSMLKEDGAGMRIDNVHRLVTALGGELIIRDKPTGIEWKIDFD